MSGPCFNCNAKSNVYADSRCLRTHDTCADCLLPNLTWKEARSGMYHFNKATLRRLVKLKMIALQMQQFNRRVLEWEEKYGKPYNLEGMPANVVREEKHMDPNWYPDLHEICDLAE